MHTYMSSCDQNLYLRKEDLLTGRGAGVHYFDFQNWYVCMYVCMYVYCAYYAPICRANGVEKASFARIVGAERRAADYIQKAV